MYKNIITYDRMYLIPKYSELIHRKDANIQVEFLGRKYASPVIPSNMEAIINEKLAKYFSENKYFYIMHRFNNATTSFVQNNQNLSLISISVGVTNISKNCLLNISKNKWRVDVITIDVAHGHHKNVKDMIMFIKNLDIIGNPKLIVGNVATKDGYKYLCDLDVDAVKVGIGGGSICTTKNKTGFHVPTPHSVWDCDQLGCNIPIIADGGATQHGDIAKAMTLGATMIMSGAFFADCIDSPAPFKNGKKIYYGSTSYMAKEKHTHIEGTEILLDHSCTIKHRLTEIKENITSSISYAGGHNISIFNYVNWFLL